MPSASQPREADAATAQFQAPYEVSLHDAAKSSVPILELLDNKWHERMSNEVSARVETISDEIGLRLETSLDGDGALVIQSNGEKIDYKFASSTKDNKSRLEFRYRGSTYRFDLLSQRPFQDNVHIADDPATASAAVGATAARRARRKRKHK